MTESNVADAIVSEAPQMAITKAPDGVARAPRSNTLQPISRLPVEVLSLIFVIYASGTRYPTRYHTCVGGFKRRSIGTGWLDVTQVCRVWRNVALSCPSLWSCGKIPFHLGSGWAKTFLARSGALTVNMDLNFTSKEPKRKPERWAAELVSTHLHRVRELRVDNNCIAMIENHQGEVPHLTSIFLDFPKPVHLTASSGVYLLLNAPLLRSMKLHNMICDLSLLTLTHMRSLELYRTRVEPVPLLMALSAAPLLEQLCLRGIPPSSLQADTSQVHCDRLRSIIISGDGTGVLILWRGIVYPPSARAVFQIASHNLAPATVNDLLQLAGQHLRRVGQEYRPITKSSVTIANTDPIAITAFLDHNTDQPFSKADGTCGGASVFLLHFNRRNLPEPIEMAPFMHALYTDSCTVLDLETMNDIETPFISNVWNVEAWFAVMPDTAHVVALRIAGCGAVSFVEAALCFMERDGDACLFPSLDYLHLRKVNFGEKTRTSTAGDTPPFYTALISWMKKRKRFGIKSIRKLVIQDCRILAKWLVPFEQLDDLVVDWDGNTGFSEDAGHNYNDSAHETILIT